MSKGEQMKKNILIISISVIIVAISVGFFLYTLTVKNTKLDPEEVVKDIKVENEVSKTQDIENVNYNDATLFKKDRTEVKISDYKDKPIMLLFFSEESEESMEVLKKVEELYPNYKETIQFFMINTDKEVNEELAKKHSLEIYYDFYEETAIKYNKTQVPSMIYINDLNEVFNAKEGFTTTDALEANLDILSNNF